MNSTDKAILITVGILAAAGIVLLSIMEVSEYHEMKLGIENGYEQIQNERGNYIWVKGDK